MNILQFFYGLLKVINVIEKFDVLTAAVTGIERALPRRGHLADPFIPPLISQNIESVFALCKVLVIQRFTKYFKLAYFLQSLLRDGLCTSARKKRGTNVLIMCNLRRSKYFSPYL